MRIICIPVAMHVFPTEEYFLPSMVIDIPAEIYEQLEAQARQAGTTPETLAREFLKTALQAREKPQPRTAHEVLQAAVVFVP
jgi:hypothetical protein